MDRQAFISFLKVFNMKASDGIVKDRAGYIYGLATALGFKVAEDSRLIPYETIALIGFTEKTQQFSITYEDGNEEIINGSKYVDVVALVGTSGVQRKVPKTIKQLNDVFPILFPDVDSQLYYDALNERDMIDLAMLGVHNEAGGHDIVPIDDTILDMLMERIEAKLAENNFVGNTMPNKDVVISVLNIRTYSHSRNAFKTWVEGLKWDGKPRVRRWLRDFFGATAPALENLGLSDMYLEEVSQAWILGAIARNFPVRDAMGVVMKNVKHEIVPVFIGDQGIGKGTALRITAGQDKWYIETTESVKEPSKFLDGVRGHVIVELSETTQLRTSDAETLKGFISKGSDQMRKPYGRFTGDYPRHFIMAASSNMAAVFTDVTGNRRFFPMYCDPTKATIEFTDNRSAGQEEVEQMWAEALVLFQQGAQWKVSTIVSELAGIMQEFSSVENPNVELINNWVDDPMNGYSEKGCKISKKVILEGVFHISHGEYIPTDINKAYNAWEMGTKSFTKCIGTIRVNGKPDRGLMRVLSPGEIKPVVRLGMKKSDYDFSVWKPALERLMISRAKQFNYSQVEDVFPIDGIPPSIVLMLLENGYIYEEATGMGAVIYRVGEMPCEEGEEE